MSDGGPALGGTGVVLPPQLRLPVHAYAEIARQAESLGYNRVWATEAGNQDAFGVLAACALATTRIGLATGIVPIQTRTPALTAQSAATIQDLSAGRFTLGLGVSSAVVVGDWNGVPWDPSLRRVREYLTIVSELLTGARVTCESGPYVMRGSRLLMHVPDPPPAVVLAALGPNMLSLAGEMASGAVLNYAGSRSVPDLVGRVQAAAKAAQRADGGKTAIFVRACVVDDPELARLFVQREVMYHVTVKAYRRVFEAQGWGEACTEAMRWWAEGDRKRAAASLPDAMTDALILAGPAEDIRARFEAFRETGVDEPIVFPIASRTDPTQARAELDATLCALAPASRPSENWR